MNNKMPKCSVGGQALINGIMMTSPSKTAISVRKPNGEILTTDFNIIRNQSFLSKFPIVRGCINFVQSMIIGTKAMNYSAEISMIEENKDTKTDITNKIDIATDKINESIEEINLSCINENIKEEIAEEVNDIAEEIKEEIEDIEEKIVEDIKEENKGKIATTIGSIIGTILGLLLSTILFVWLPSLLYNLLPFNSNENPLFRSVFEGILKFALMIGYMAAVSYIPDIRKVFQYHGAEHKSIFCYEKGIPLTIENIKKQTRFHPRCGTSFIIISIFISILVGFFIPVTNPIIRTLIKVLLLPFTVGLSYEIIKFCGKYDNIITKILSAPGCWIQRITTKEPTDDIIEVAIEALNSALKYNN